MKKVLFLTYFFPPAGGAGVQRSSKFAKYLPKFGWQPVVVAAGIGQTDREDRTLLKDVSKSTPVRYVKSFDPHRLFKQTAAKKSRQSGVFLKAYIRKLAKFALRLVFIPDEFVFWGPGAYRAAEEFVNKFHPSVIYSSSVPNTAHLVAWRLKKKYGLPWVADLRDEWSDDPWKFHPTPLHRKLDRYLEEKALGSADRIVTVTPGIVGKLKAHHRRPIDLIENGYDEDDFNFSSLESAKFEITYVGSLYDQLTPVDLLQSIKELAQERKVDLRHVRINLVGKISAEVAHDIAKFQEELPINTPGYLAHQKSVGYLRSASVLFLIVWSKDALSGKVFEYLASKKPILGYVVAGGDAERLLQKVGCQTFAHYGKRRELKKVVLSMYKSWLSGKLRATYKDVEQFSRRRQAERLAKIFNETTAA